jgi:hypothetical protein
LLPPDDRLSRRRHTPRLDRRRRPA